MSVNHFALGFVGLSTFHIFSSGLGRPFLAGKFHGNMVKTFANGFGQNIPNFSDLSINMQRMARKELPEGCQEQHAHHGMRGKVLENRIPCGSLRTLGTHETRGLRDCLNRSWRPSGAELGKSSYALCRLARAPEPTERTLGMAAGGGC